MRVRSGKGRCQCCEPLISLNASFAVDKIARAAPGHRPVDIQLALLQVRDRPSSTSLFVIRSGLGINLILRDSEGLRLK
jgi:hypothetical protein